MGKRSVGLICIVGVAASSEKERREAIVSLLPCMLDRHTQVRRGRWFIQVGRRKKKEHLQTKGAQDERIVEEESPNVVLKRCVYVVNTYRCCHYKHS